MEKENKKKRDAAKKKYNEIVRVSLTSYGLFFVAYLSNFYLSGTSGICKEERQACSSIQGQAPLKP